jgi:hypothetical protein
VAGIVFEFQKEIERAGVLAIEAGLVAVDEVEGAGLIA